MLHLLVNYACESVFPCLKDFYRLPQVLTYSAFHEFVMRDEVHHAAFAWRTIQWGLELPSVRAQLDVGELGKSLRAIPKEKQILKLF